MGLGKRSTGEARIADGGDSIQNSLFSIKSRAHNPVHRYDDGTGQEGSKFNFRWRWVAGDKKKKSWEN